MQTNYERGASMIEVLVTLLLISTALLGLAAMQVRALQQNNDALLRTQANFIAYDLLDRVRMQSPMAPAALVIPSQTIINTLAAAQLPNGSGTLTCTAARICNVRITWTENSPGEEDEDAIFVYSTRL